VRSSPRFTVQVNACARGSKKKPALMTSSGDSPEEAARALTEDLDSWVEALK
jgi:hypothetical protein